MRFLFILEVSQLVNNQRHRPLTLFANSNRFFSCIIASKTKCYFALYNIKRERYFSTAHMRYKILEGFIYPNLEVSSVSSRLALKYCAFVLCRLLSFTNFRRGGL